MSTPIQTFATLLRREIWEHKGGFVYAPIVVAGVLVLLLLISGISVFFIQGKVDGSEEMTKGALLLAATNVPAETLEMVVAKSLGMSSVFWQCVMFIVLFFYCIGSLYDDRRDRSVLFWKSMPVSDLETVGSKVVTALVVAPLIMFGVMILGQILLLLVSGLVVLMHGGSPWNLIWSHAHPFRGWAQFLVVQGVQVLYLLPLFGWLMLAGSFARGKAFLWAILPPIVLAIFESWVSFLSNFKVSHVIWEFILSRMAAGIAPLSYTANFAGGSMETGFSGTRYAASFSDVLARLGTADLWIGVVIGVAFLGGAVYLRRYRDESTS